MASAESRAAASIDEHDRRNLRVVSLNASPRPFLMRAIGRIRRQLWGYYWRSRLAGFGAGSSIDRPDNISGAGAIWIGASVTIWWGARIEAVGASARCRCVTIGDGTVIHPYVHIGAMQSVSIGVGVLMASRVYISDHDHDFSKPDEPPVQNGRLTVASVAIGDFAWIGEGAMILKGVEIGEHSVIGAGSVVTSDIPPFSVAVGAPARVIRHYDSARGVWTKTDSPRRRGRDGSSRPAADGIA
jgi:lipopolysaccharide O-acetyltransferase